MSTHLLGRFLRNLKSPLAVVHVNWSSESERLYSFLYRLLLCRFGENFHRFTFGKYIHVQKKICIKNWNASWLSQLIKPSVKSKIFSTIILKYDVYWKESPENYHRWSVSVFLPLVNELLFPTVYILVHNESFSTCFTLTPNTFLNLAGIFRWTLLPVLETASKLYFSITVIMKSPFSKKETGLIGRVCLRAAHTHRKGYCWVKIGELGFSKFCY